MDLALENSLVIRKIAACFSGKELMKLCLVNKTWNHELQSFVRDKRECVTIISGVSPCSRGKELNDLIGSINVNPFRGFSITIGPHECADGVRERKVEEIYGNLLKMPVKYLDFNWSKTGNTENCPLGQLIMRLMSGSPTLEHLHIKDIPTEIKLQDENRPEEGPLLPKLKTLELPTDFHELTKLFWANLVEILVERSPNLQVLKNAVFLDWFPFMPRNKVHAIKELFIPPVIRENQKIFLLMDLFFLSSPKLETLSAVRPRFIADDVQNEAYASFLRRVMFILVKCANCLQRVELDLFSAFAIVTGAVKVEAVWCLPGVTSLKLQLASGKNPGIVRYLLQVPLHKFFPKVTFVTLSLGDHTIGDAEENIDELGQKFPWSEVTDVKLDDFMLSDRTVFELGVLFPNVRKFTACADLQTPESLPFGQLCSSLPSLEALVLAGILETEGELNFDAQFCGIHPEEAAILQEKDEEFLKAVNIVAPFPSICHLKHLKRIFIGLRAVSVSPPPEASQIPSRKLFLSKVSALTALKHQIKLEVVAPREILDHLQHLTEFVKSTAVPTIPDRARSRSDAYELNYWQNFRSLFDGFDDIDDADDDDTEVDFTGRF